MQHPRIGHDAAKSPVTFREMRSLTIKIKSTAYNPGYLATACHLREI